MDLGLAGKRAIVCAASRGLGRGCAMALAREGVELVLNGRNEETLAKTAGEIREATGAVVHAVAADITTAEGRAAVLEACPDPDILVNNAGGPPPGDFRNWTREDWIGAVDMNMLTPIDLIKATLDGMIERRFGRIVNITSAAVKSPIPILGLSNAARAGLTGFIAGLSRQTVRHNVTINGLLPGPFATDRLRATMKTMAESKGQDPQAFWQAQQEVHPAGRFGAPDEFGAMCAFLCSAHAGYITGQNILLDGGQFNGTL